MDETELSLLDKLMLAVSASESPKIVEQKSTLNEDEFFLAQIAANDLKVFNNPQNARKLKKSDSNTPETPSTSQNSNNTKTKKHNLSLIHTGDTDSSDDESNKYFENVNLNDCGKTLKHLLPEVPNKNSVETASQSLSKTWKPIPPLKFGLPSVQQSPKSNENILQDPFFGIRISKPLISSAILEERMTGRAAISMFRVKNFIAQNGQTQDWVIAGCIVQKSNARTSQSGNQYIIWTLSDLQNDLQSVSVFLFKNAYKELWKTCVGTVVGILNPSILDNREGSRHQATLSLDNYQRVMIFGQSKDYGVCKSRKKDGTPCTAFVNTNRCSFCLYHVKQEYQKCSLRSDCQSTSGGGLTALRNKVLGKNEVFYAGKSYAAIPARKNKKLVERDTKRLSDLKNNLVTSSVPTQRKKKPSASTLEVSRAQRFKDLQLLQKLNGTSDILSGLETRKNCNLDDVSTGVTLEESRKTALDIIAKLKAKNNQNIETSTAALNTLKTLKSPESIITKIQVHTTPKLSRKTALDVAKLQTKNNQNIEPSTSTLKTSKILKTPETKITKQIKENLIDTSKLNCNLNDSTTLDVITKLKTKNNQNIEPSTSTLKTLKTLKSPELITKQINENVIDTSKLNCILNDSTLEKSSKTTLDVITKLKTKNNQNIEPSTSTLKTIKSPELITKQINENLIDTSKLNCNLNDSTLEKSNKAILDVITKLKTKNIEPSTTALKTLKSPELITKQIKENLIDTSTLNCNLDDSTLEKSKKTTLDVITKLKTKTNQNIEPSTSALKTLKMLKSPELITKQIKENLNDTSKLNCDLDDLIEVPLEKSRKTTLDVITKLKTKNNQNIEPSTAALNTLKTLKSPESKITKIQGHTAPKLSRKTGQDVTKLKTKNNQNIEPSTSTLKTLKTPESKITKQIKENLIDTSRLKLLKDLHTAPAPKLSQNSVIDLNSPLPDRAKLKALHWVQKNGPINKTNPSGAQKTGVKRFLENTELSSPDAKKSKLNEKIQFSDRFRKIMALTSTHADLLEQRDLDEQDKYFNKLEQREKMEEKMMTTYKVQCKAVKCLNCKYTSFSAAPKCKEEKHALKVYDAIKRFFKCGNCGNRTVALEVCPIFSCKNCGSSKWERTTMMKEKIVRIGDGLSIRGGEQKFVNSVTTDANINLLMPDD